MKFLVFFILSPLFIAKTNALKCLVCDSIDESIDNVCQLKECEESAKEWFEFYEENGSEKLNSKDQASLNAYYYNITKNTKLSKRNLSEWRNIFDTCISKFGLRDGKPVKLKACGTKRACKNGTDLDVFHSCSTCDTDYCNTLQCYSCGDRFTDKFSLTPCNNSINQNFCYGDHMRCFSAIDVKSDKTIEFRGCIYNNETEIATEIFKKQAMLYYFCEENLCNKKTMKTSARTSQNRDNSGKSKSRHKKSTEEEEYEERLNDIKCMQCKDVAMNASCEWEVSCSSYFKRNKIEVPKKKKLHCVSANGTLDGEHQMKYKDCTYEGSDICNELKEKGYDSCSTCDEGNCNALHCYECEREEIFEENKLTPCKKVEIVPCLSELKTTSQCFSANTVLNGKDIMWKGCIEKEESEEFTKHFEHWDVPFYFCDQNHCNKKKIEIEPHSNVTEPEEKERSASQRLVLHYPPTAVVIIIMCIYLLF